MQFEIRSASMAQAARSAHDALLILWPDTADAGGGADGLSEWIAQARKRGDFANKVGETLQSYGMAGVKPRRVVAVACGDGQPAALRQAVQAAWAALPAAGTERLAVQWAGDALPAAAVAALVAALGEASYVYETTLSKPTPRALQHVTLGWPAASAAQRSALAQAQAVLGGVELTKEWANRPANYATPTLLAQAAQALTAHPHVQCKVLGPREVEKLGMGAFMAVAQGSAQPLRFVVLQYNGAAAKEAPVVLIGKGVTFDTGGISLKPGAEMDEMKFDMSGAASVLGVFEALGRLQPRINVVGLIAATENMPSGQAIKPGDVVTSMSGQTIEILNTDAEGRLVLCDALTYAQRFEPRAVIDIATLTGACVIALGAVRSGLFSPDDALAQALAEAGEASADLCWRMPLDAAYGEGLKSNFADVANIGGRPAGSVTAAKFLQRFAGPWPWAHLDIAGTAWRSGKAKGATGRPVGLLVQYLLAQQGAAAAAPVAAAPAASAARRRSTRA